ncbi:hypothetical protein RUM43_011825 [Polyplax serrata]|uniref:Uncharacterized protein n=1 Tax=Polyplax serrata TaxID=468196 RepID=A0AAN8S6M1_POLSC
MKPSQVSLRATGKEEEEEVEGRLETTSKRDHEEWLEEFDNYDIYRVIKVAPRKPFGEVPLGGQQTPVLGYLEI